MILLKYTCTLQSYTNLPKLKPKNLTTTNPYKTNTKNIDTTKIASSAMTLNLTKNIKLTKTKQFPQNQHTPNTVKTLNPQQPVPKRHKNPATLTRFKNTTKLLKTPEFLQYKIHTKTTKNKPKKQRRINKTKMNKMINYI
jgi:hypothetical protein